MRISDWSSDVCSSDLQQALARAAETVSGQSAEQLKRRLRTGTIVTTDDRNWELRYSRSALRFSLSRAVGIDMESATIPAQGDRKSDVSGKSVSGRVNLGGRRLSKKNNNNMIPT